MKSDLKVGLESQIDQNKKQMRKDITTKLGIKNLVNKQPVKMQGALKAKAI